MPLDPAVIRDNLLDYGARTFWALVVALITLLVARGLRGATMRMLARNRAQANGTFMTSAVVNLTRFPTRRASAWLVLPADEKAIASDDVRAALSKAEGISAEPPPSIELRSVADGKAQYLVTFWAANRDAALAQALHALRARFPQGEVHIG